MMPTVKLTQVAWLEHEKERIKGVLLMHLSRDGIDQGDLRQLILDWGLDYSNQDLVTIRDALVAEGIIEID
jgi:hypothetical protein